MIDSGFCTQPTVVVVVNVASSISPSVYIVEMPSSYTVDNDKKVQAKSLLDTTCFATKICFGLV